MKVIAWYFKPFNHITSYSCTAKLNLDVIYLYSVTLQEYCMHCMHVLENHLPIVKMPGLPLWKFFSTQWRNWKAWNRRPWREIERGRIFEARTQASAHGMSSRCFPALPSDWRSYVAFRRHGTVFFYIFSLKATLKITKINCYFLLLTQICTRFWRKKTLLMTQVSFWCFMRLEWTKFIEFLSIYPTEGFCVFDFGISSLIKLTHEQNICAARFFFRFLELIPKDLIHFEKFFYL